MRLQKRVRSLALATAALLSLSALAGVSQAIADDDTQPALELAAENIVHVTDSNFSSIVAKSNSVPVIFVLGAEWCGACKQYDPQIENTARRYAGKFILAHVDVDKTSSAKRALTPGGYIPESVAYGHGKEMTQIKRQVGSPGTQAAVDAYVNSVIKAFGPVEPTKPPTTKPATSKPPTTKPPTTQAPTETPTDDPTEDPSNDEVIVHVTNGTFQSMIKKSNEKPVIFVLGATWCGACKQYDPQINDTAKRYNGKFIVAHIDVDKVSVHRSVLKPGKYIPESVAYGRGQELTSIQRQVGSPGNQAAVDAYVDSVIKAFGPVEPTKPPTTKPPTTQPPTTKPPTTKPPTTKPPTTKPPTTQPPTTEPPSDGKLPPLPPGAVQVTDEGMWQKDVIEESSKRVVIVDFSKDMCEPCTQLAPVLDELYKAGDGKWQYVRIDGTQVPKIWESLNKPWFPTLIAFKDGKEIARRSGYEGDKEAVTKWINDAVTGGPVVTDPTSMDIKSKADWDKAKEISFRHPVIFRMSMDSYYYSNRFQKESVEKMAAADGAKWTAATCDKSQAIYGDIMSWLGEKAYGMPVIHVIVYQGVPRYEEPLTVLHQFGAREQVLRDWINVALSHHYKPVSTEN